MQATQLSPAIGERIVSPCHEYRCALRNSLLFYLGDLEPIVWAVLPDWRALLSID
jgi:hypothetical protein